MQNKKVLIIIVVVLIIVNIFILCKYYFLLNVHSGCNSIINELEKEEQLLKIDLVTQYENLINQYQIEKGSYFFSNIYLYNENEEKLRFDFFIPDTTFVIWISEGACDACILSLLNICTEYYKKDGFKHAISVIIESRNIKKAILLKEQYDSNVFKFYTCNITNIFTFNERPICFIYIYNNVIRHPFIPIMEINTRTHFYFDFLKKNYQL